MMIRIFLICSRLIWVPETTRRPELASHAPSRAYQSPAPIPAPAALLPRRCSSSSSIARSPRGVSTSGWRVGAGARARATLLSSAPVQRPRILSASTPRRPSSWPARTRSAPRRRLRCRAPAAAPRFARRRTLPGARSPHPPRDHPNRRPAHQYYQSVDRFGDQRGIRRSGSGVVAPRRCESPLGSGAGKEEISYLLATRVDFGSVKHYTAVVIATDRRAVLFRSEIDDAGAEIPPRCHIKPYQSCLRPRYPCPCSLVKVVL